MKVINELQKQISIRGHALVGSRATCSPAPTETDEDHLLLVLDKDVQAAIGVLHSEGFHLDHPSAHYRPEDGIFNSWRKEDVNLIVTSDPIFYRRFLSASNVAKKLNLLEKADRVTLFQSVLYGNFSEEFPQQINASSDDATPWPR